MAKGTSFEQLCTGKSGYCCEMTSMVKLTKSETYNELVFKLITKVESSILFLPSPTCFLNKFTLDIIPNFSEKSIALAWQNCEKSKYDGLHVIAALDESNMPKSSSTSPSYSFAQFINSLIHSLESHFMFQRHNSHFALNALNLWKADEDLGMKSCAVALVWKFERKTIEDILQRSPLSLNNNSLNGNDDVPDSPRAIPKRKSEILKEAQSKRKSLVQKNSHSAPAPRGRPRGSSRAADASDEEDPDISFKKKPDPVIMPKIRYLEGMSPQKKVEEEPMETEPSVPEEPMTPANFTLGFEKAQPKKNDRKSNARKSLAADFPEDEKNEILQMFDNLNPAKTEQSRVALTLKYVQLQFDRDLPSKLLYQWIQKKGRTVNKTAKNFEIPETEQQKATLDLFKELNPEAQEKSRIAFICKFVNLQYGITLTSKEFYDLLNGKGKKASKRR